MRFGRVRDWHTRMSTYVVTTSRLGYATASPLLCSLLGPTQRTWSSGLKRVVVNCMQWRMLLEELDASRDLLVLPYQFTHRPTTRRQKRRRHVGKFQ